MTHQTLDELIAKTPKHLEPSTNLWSNIESRLDVAPIVPKNRHWQMLSVACSFALLLTLGTLYWPQSSNVGGPDKNVLIMLAQLQQQHQQQVTQLMTLDNNQQLNNSATFVSLGDQALNTAIKELREAARQIFLALKSDPHDQQLLQLWLWTQSRELELLQQTSNQWGSPQNNSATDKKANSSI